SEVEKFLSETKMSRADFAHQCGYSPAVISSWMSGKYTGDVERVKTRIIGAIELYRERQARHRPASYVSTDQSRSIEAAIMYARNQQESAIVLAESGLGKST